VRSQSRPRLCVSCNAKGTFSLVVRLSTCNDNPAQVLHSLVGVWLLAFSRVCALFCVQEFFSKLFGEQKRQKDRGGDDHDQRLRERLVNLQKLTEEQAVSGFETRTCYNAHAWLWTEAQEAG
jgi:hypothetical protein